MKKVNLFLVSLIALVTLSVGFSSCGGGSSNGGSSNGITINSRNPFVGTWVPRDGNSIFQSIVIGEYVTSVTVTYKSGTIVRDSWEMVQENTDKSKCIISLYKTGSLEFDDTSLLNASMSEGNYKFKRSN